MIIEARKRERRCAILRRVVHFSTPNFDGSQLPAATIDSVETFTDCSPYMCSTIAMIKYRSSHPVQKLLSYSDKVRRRVVFKTLITFFVLRLVLHYCTSLYNNLDWPLFLAATMDSVETSADYSSEIILVLTSGSGYIRLHTNSD